MSRVIQLPTDRLLLRQWHENDFAAFATLNSDPAVMRYFPSLLSNDQSNEFAQRLQNTIQQQGWGLWAIERRHDHQFIGYCGLQAADECLDCAPATEIGWRLAADYWHAGYATEAAQAVIRFAFSSLQIDALVAYTSTNNLPSIALMQRLGMQFKDNFQHPKLGAYKDLYEHALYTLNAE